MQGSYVKITLICPNFGNRGGHPLMSAAVMEPLALAVLAGLTPAGIDVRAYDERVEAIPFDEPTDLVGITVDTFGARRAYEIAAIYRGRGVPVVMGGIHASVVPDEAAQHADAVVIGEAEDLWPQVLEDARSGCLKARYEAATHPSIAGRAVRRDVLDSRKYLPISLVQFNRGCPYNCDFCSVSTFYKKYQQQRPVEDVVREIQQAPHKLVLIVDDNVIGVPERAKDLFRALIPLGIRWVSQASIDFARDPELVDLAARSGCVGLIIGLESLNQANLKQMRKGWTTTDNDVRGSLAVIRRAGIMVYATFVLGYDDDGTDVFDRTVDFALAQKFFLANFNHLQPFPGTTLYKRLLGEGRLVHDPWWLSDEYRFGQAAFVPRGLTPEQLTDGCLHARMRFTAGRSIFRRALDFQANMRDPFRAWIFLTTNLTSRRDILRKQGASLGGREGDTAAELQLQNGPTR